ncbi:hypothetical protein L0U85_09655 [Glycomyces sp. L485]|uniref:hypothetical protein n=1 Tax=Glycomyces sp. L485 TaxID=2909235 RepID=UPI001F4AC11A|nr:hypothetical protein [Glycomyces sp. L485]MCH7231116.1 hypothetical protein [Glycomyces sp. L485]
MSDSGEYNPYDDLPGMYDEYANDPDSRREVEQETVEREVEEVAGSDEIGPGNPPEDVAGFPTRGRLLERLEWFHDPFSMMEARRLAAETWPDHASSILSGISSQYETTQYQNDHVTRYTPVGLRWSGYLRCPVPEDAKESTEQALRDQALASAEALIADLTLTFEETVLLDGQLNKAYWTTVNTEKIFQRFDSWSGGSEYRPGGSGWHGYNKINDMFQNSWKDDAATAAEDRYGKLQTACRNKAELSRNLTEAAASQLALSVNSHLALDYAIDQAQEVAASSGLASFTVEAKELTGFSIAVGALGLVWSGIPWTLNATGFALGLLATFAAGAEIVVKFDAPQDANAAANIAASLKQAAYDARDQRMEEASSDSAKFWNESTPFQSLVGSPEFIPGSGG